MTAGCAALWASILRNGCVLGRERENGRCLCLFWRDVITLVDGCGGLFTRSRDYENCRNLQQQRNL